MTDYAYIPLLSPKPFEELSEEEFLNMVMALHQEKHKKMSAKKEVPYKATVTKTGTLSLKVNRDPKKISLEEIKIALAMAGIELIEIIEEK